MCTFGRCSYLYFKFYSVFQHVEMTIATLALWTCLLLKFFRRQEILNGSFSWNLDEEKKRDQRQATKPKLFQVETPFEAPKLPVPNPATVPVAGGENWISNGLKTVGNTLHPQTLPSLSGRPSDLTHSTAVNEKACTTGSINGLLIPCKALGSQIIRQRSQVTAGTQMQCKSPRGWI